MTQVQSLAATRSTVSTSSADTSTTSAASLDYDAFLQLLVAQLQNQDPTAPMDSTAYMSQLASFSQVEQQVKTNTKLDAILAACAVQGADSTIGRTVTSADGTVEGTVSGIEITDDGAVARLTEGGTVSLASGVTIR